MPPLRYPSDLSNTEWPSSNRCCRLPKSAAVRQSGRRGTWRMLPHEYPTWQTVYYNLCKWRLDGRLRRAHDRLREEVRQAEGRDPSAGVIDSQVVKTTPV